MQQVMNGRTTKEWWAEVRNSPERLTGWLQKQYHGEITAASRVREFCNHFIEPTSKWHSVISRIADQEGRHAGWVGELLQSRGIVPQVLQKEERYWNETLAGVTTGAGLAAAAAHAEQMRLERIRVIAEDPATPRDIQSVFEKILPEEEFHAKAFAALAGNEALAEALERHEHGMAAINLSMESMFPDKEFYSNCHK